MGDGRLSLTSDDTLASIDTWTPAAKEQAMRAVQARLEGSRVVFYCQPDPGNPKLYGRNCDGEPHGAYTYNHARADQWPPLGQEWFVWALMGGRGSGKTRSGSEYTRKMSDKVSRIALIGATTQAIRDTMIEGESGLMAVFANMGQDLQWEPSKHRVTFPSGCIGTTFSAEEPRRLRGPQHGFAWLDEPSHYDDPDEVWNQLLFGLRLGDRPHAIVTTTPLPNEWTQKIVEEPDTVLVRVSTYANLNNLADNYRKTIKQFEGTRLGRQELEGEILTDVPGSLWKDWMIVYSTLPYSAFERIIVAIDPAGTANRRSDLTGIVAVGLLEDEIYPLADWSGKYSPQGWADKAIALYDMLSADAIVVEKNYGGDMVKTTIDSVLEKKKRVIRILVKTAMRSKQLRAEPVVALYEQKRAHHNDKDGLEDLEKEMLKWIPGKGDSPNRIDALVWAVTELMGFGGTADIATPTGTMPTRSRGPSNTYRAPIGRTGMRR
jgi:phage terminase large subunit-like protein